MLDERQMPAMNWMMQKLYPHVGHHIVCVTYPWFIQVENGKAVKEKTALGGVHMKKGSYQKGQTVFLNINDYDFFRLMQQTSRYIETWELTYGPKLIREAQQIIAAQQRAAADEDLPA